MKGGGEENAVPEHKHTLVAFSLNTGRPAGRPGAGRRGATIQRAKEGEGGKRDPYGGAPAFGDWLSSVSARRVVAVERAE